MEPKGSLSCSKDLATWPYSVSDKFIPHPSFVCKIHLMVFFLCLGPRSLKLPVSFSFPTTIRYALLFSPSCATWPVISALIWSPYCIWWRVQLRKLLIMQFNAPSCDLLSLGPNILSILFLYTSLCSSRIVKHHFSHPLIYGGASHHIYCNNCTIVRYNNTHTW